jgi:cysteine desulfurase
MRLPGGRIYLDCNATTPIDPAVEEVIHQAAVTLFGNPSSPYREGRDARGVLESSRERIAGFAGCRSDEVVFTSSGTEANHLALRSAALARPGRNRVLVSAIEHPSVYEQKSALEKAGCRVDEIPVEASGRLDLGALESMLDKDVAVVTVMTAHNETGVVQPVAEAARISHASGALFHTDAVQAAGKVALPWGDAGADYLVMAAHKFYGPKGIAALAVRAGAPVHPILTGGGQERGLRASTESVALAAGMAKACECATAAVGLWQAVTTLRNTMEERLARDFGALVYGAGAERLPNTSFLGLPGVDAARLVERLDEMGFAVATGSACHSDSTTCPRVLQKMGRGDGAGASTVRISLGRTTTGEDVDAFRAAFPDAMETAGRKNA